MLRTVISSASDSKAHMICPADIQTHFVQAIPSASARLSPLFHSYNHYLALKTRRLENFVFETKEARLLKLIDFGLSNRYSGGGIKRMNTLVGTPYYMAPEVLDRKVEYGNVRAAPPYGVGRFLRV